MKPKDEKKLAAIAAATYQLVGQRGLFGLTLADIARAAHIATSTLYVYYPSKEALLDALYGGAKNATFSRWTQGDDSAAPYKMRVRRMWLNMLADRLERHAQLLFQEQYHGSPNISAANRELGAQFARFFSEFLARGQAEEILKAVPIAFLIASIAGSSRETARQIRAGGLLDNEETRNTAFMLCWDAIKA